MSTTKAQTVNFRVVSLSEHGDKDKLNVQFAEDFAPGEVPAMGGSGFNRVIDKVDGASYLPGAKFVQTLNPSA